MVPLTESMIWNTMLIKLEVETRLRLLTHRLTYDATRRPVSEARISRPAWIWSDIFHYYKRGYDQTDILFCMLQMMIYKRGYILFCNCYKRGYPPLYWEIPVADECIQKRICKRGYILFCSRYFVNIQKRICHFIFMLLVWNDTLGSHHIKCPVVSV